MALNVVLCHFCCVYFPALYQASWSKYEHYDWELAICNGPLNALLNGDIAVRFFFILSGFLSAMIVCKSYANFDVVIRIFKRYCRLLPVVAVATFFTFLLLKMNAIDLSIASVVRNKDFLSDYYNFTPTIRSLLNNIFVKPFWSGGSDYVGPFWTLKYEISGPLLIYVLGVLGG